MGWPCSTFDSFHVSTRGCPTARCGGPTALFAPTRANFPPGRNEEVLRGQVAFCVRANRGCWSVSKRPEGYRICQWVRSERYRGAGEEDRENEIRLPADTPIEEVARRAATVAMSKRSLRQPEHVNRVVPFRRIQLRHFRGKLGNFQIIPGHHANILLASGLIGDGADGNIPA